jgi:arsenite-transporting ATPase
MALTRLGDKSLQLILFGGKGGVGKTTMAVSSALELAKEKRVLIFTTDPAPSLTDSFGQLIGDEPTAVAGMPNLFALEINAQKVFQDLKKQYSRDFLEVMQQGTYLSNEDVESMFSLDLPGMDEVMSFKKIVDFIESSDYDLYVVDTAPTGHTLRLLLLPELLNSWIKFLAKLRWKHKTMLRAFGGAKQIEKADTFLLEMKKTIKRISNLLLDPEKTEFVAVTIPEKMAVSETEDLLKSLELMHIASRHVIVNNMFPHEASDFTELGNIMRTSRSRAEGFPSALPFFNSNFNLERYLDYAEIRRKTQEKYIHEIEQKFSTHTITEVLLQPTELQGIDALKQLGAYLFSETPESADQTAS